MPALDNENGHRHALAFIRNSLPDSGPRHRRMPRITAGCPGSPPGEPAHCRETTRSATAASSIVSVLASAFSVASAPTGTVSLLLMWPIDRP